VPEFLFPRHHIPAEDLFASGDQESIDRFLKQNSVCAAGLRPNSPYCLEPLTGSGPIVLQHLQQLPETHRHQLACAVDELGDQTNALAAFYERQLAGLELNSSSGVLGAGAAASGARLTAFQRTMRDYQQALLKLHEHRRPGHAGIASRMQFESIARQKYSIMERHYRAELSAVARPAFRNKNRGNVLNSADRGVVLANRRRSANLFVDNVAEVRRLDTLARGIRFAGNGVIVLDAGVRLRSVHDSYQRNENWQRELAIETTGFGAAGVAGIGIGKAAVTTLSAIGLGMTPLGWVVLIGIGLAAGYTAGSVGNSFGKRLATLLFDWRR
jgi:hypothetical protein